MFRLLYGIIEAESHLFVFFVSFETARLPEHHFFLSYFLLFSSDMAKDHHTPIARIVRHKCLKSALQITIFFFSIINISFFSIFIFPEVPPTTFDMRIVLIFICYSPRQMPGLVDAGEVGD